MTNILKILKKINSLEIFYFIILFSVVLSFLEYFFIFSIYEIVNYQVTGELGEIIKNLIFLTERILNINKSPFDIIFFFIVCSFFFKTLIYIFFNYSISKFSQNISFKLGKKIFLNSIFNNQDILINKKNSNYFKNTIVVDIPIFISSAIQPLFFLLNDLFILSTIVIFLFFINPSISLLLLIFISITCLIFYLYLKNKLIVWGKSREKASSNLLKSLNEVYKGILEIKIYNLGYFFYSRFAKDLKIIKNCLTNTNFFIHFPRIILEIIIFSSVFILIFLTSNYFSDTNIVPYLSAAIAAAIKVIPMFSRIMTGVQGYYFAKRVIIKINSMLKYNINLLNFTKSKQKFNKINFLKIENLSYQIKGKNLLNKIDLKINSNQIVGIAGESGSGKSTFARIVSGLDKSFSGSIKFYGTDNKIHYNKPNLGLASIIPQDIFIIDDTLETNISFNQSKKIQTQNLNLINSLLKTLGIDYRRKLGEDGKKISGGQKQRVGIIRSLFFNKEVLIFDETTSNLDLRNKIALFKIIKILKKEKIIIVISHDKKFLKICDKTYILKNGKLNLKSFSS